MPQNSLVQAHHNQRKPPIVFIAVRCPTCPPFLLDQLSRGQDIVLIRLSIRLHTQATRKVDLRAELQENGGNCIAPASLACDKWVAVTKDSKLTWCFHSSWEYGSYVYWWWDKLPKPKGPQSTHTYYISQVQHQFHCAKVKVSTGLNPFLQAPRKHPSICPFQFLKAVCIPWFMATWLQPLLPLPYPHLCLILIFLLSPVSPIVILDPPR